MNKVHYVLPSIEIITPKSVLDHNLWLMEYAARQSRQSQSKIEDDPNFLFDKVHRLGHYSILKHSFISAEIECSIIVSREICRHLFPGITMESTRYISYKDGIKFVLPVGEDWTKHSEYQISDNLLNDDVLVYNSLLASDVKKDKARRWLPVGMSCRFVMTWNYRALMDFLDLRADAPVEAELRFLMDSLIIMLKEQVPLLGSAYEKMGIKEGVPWYTRRGTVRHLLVRYEHMYGKKTNLYDLADSLFDKV